MRTCFYVAGIEHVTVSESLGNGEHVGDSMLVTNDRHRIERLLSPAFRKVAGDLECASLTHDVGLIAYFLRDTQYPLEPEKRRHSLLAWIAVVRRFLPTLWLVKDNSAYIELSYLEHPHRVPGAVIERNLWGGLCSRADGTVSPTEFTRKELRQAREFYKRLMNYTMEEGKSGFPRPTRWNTAMYFLEAARSSANPGVKVAHYCTCLEGLFASDSHELAHKLSERVAAFLDDDSAGRLELFRKMKKAYGLRSKIVHGDKKGILSGAQSQDVSRTCDSVLRRCLLRILESSDLSRRFIEGKEGDFDDYFLRLLFR